MVTVPLGVLQAGKMVFVPALPDRKQTAINRLGMGVINKIALKFQQPFWPRNDQVIGYVGRQRGQYPLYVNLLHYANQPVLVCLVPPSFERIGELDAAERKGRCAGGAPQDFRQPRSGTGVDLANRWQSDPWSLGSYSFAKVGATGEDRDQLAAPVDGDSTLLVRPRIEQCIRRSTALICRAVVRHARSAQACPNG